MVGAANGRRGRDWGGCSMRRLFLLLFSILSCSDSISVRDKGALCLRSVSDGSVSVEVTFSVPCRSSSCNRVVTKSCTVEVAGSDMRVHSHVEIEDVSSGEDDCNTDCLEPDATCGVQSLQAGTHRILHGSDQAQVTVPNDPVALFDEADRLEESCQ